MSPSPNNTSAVQSVSRIIEPMEPQSKAMPSSPESSIRSSSTTTQNGISGIPLNNLNLFCESERLKTFENWPVSFISAHDLATAGLYYLNKGDLVRCPYCSIELGRWVEGDKPLVEHKKYSPHCHFIQQRHVEEGRSSSSSTPTANGYDVCGPFGSDIRKPAFPAEMSKKEAVLHKLGIQVNRSPTFPNYSSFESRLRSFESWPVSMKLKPVQLSEAGFFYTGKGDQTICFHCGGGLKDWEETDQPWVEHTRNFPMCNFVTIIKGKEFVDEICGKKTEVQSLTQEEMREVIESHKEVIPVPDLPEDESNEKAQESTSASTQTVIPDKELRKNENDSTLCRVCYSEERNAVFLPCGHLVVCGKCSIGLKTCVICRKPCEARVRVFLS